MIQLTLLRQLAVIALACRSQQYGGARRTTPREPENTIQCFEDSQGQVLMTDLTVDGFIRTDESGVVEVVR